jgi:hypothetical protein
MYAGTNPYSDGIGDSTVGVLSPNPKNKPPLPDISLLIEYDTDGDSKELGSSRLVMRRRLAAQSGCNW